MMKHVLYSLALLSTSVLASPIEARDLDVVPDRITITGSTYSGSGCPQGSVSHLVSDDKTIITFGFDQFQAAIGPNAGQNERTKNCQLHLNLKYPSGFQLSIMKATYHGYVRLDDGVTGNFMSSYFFSQAADRTASSRAQLRGPEYNNGKIYDKTDTIENASVLLSPCGGNGILNINNRIALSSYSDRAQGEMTNDDATVAFTQKLHVTWVRCNSAQYVDSAVDDDVNTVDLQTSTLTTLE